MATVWANKAFKPSLADRLPIPAILCKADKPVLAVEELDEDCTDDEELPFPSVKMRKKRKIKRKKFYLSSVDP